MSMSKTQDPRSKILFIVGPTASGKSDLAMRIAREYGGEIICADSQTIRRGMNIGTAKPTKEDRKNVVHHMLDVIDPYDRYSVAEFKTAAQEAINKTRAKGKLPIVVGGTGLYIDALLYDFKFRETKSAMKREELEKLTVGELQKIVKRKNLSLPVNAQNPRHLIRTIESAGQPSEKGTRLRGSIVVGINPGNEILLRRIKKRLEIILKTGFLQEVDRIIEEYGKPPHNFDAISYKIALEHRNDKGEYNKDEIFKKITVSEKKYAKRQMAWFKRNSDIVWFEHADGAFEYLKKIL